MTAGPPSSVRLLSIQARGGGIPIIGDMREDDVLVCSCRSQV
jgi:hypothetical protein